MNKLIELLYYGGISPKVVLDIRPDISDANRKSVIAYSIISFLGFLAMAIYAYGGGNSSFYANRDFYIMGMIIMVAILIANHYFAPKCYVITEVTAYLFVVTLFGIGIMLAVTGKEDITASYMVFLFVAPLLFTLKPIVIHLIIIASNIFYICLMYQIQTSDVFGKNIVNALIYGFLSIFVCTTMTRMRMQKFETDYMNRILMETDQLTGMLNRRSYEQHLERIKSSGSTRGVKICAFDVNGLKQVNDNIGHHAGDELLRGAAACLENVFGHYGYCYRVGGDEFVAILQGSSPEEEELLDLLKKQTVSFKGTYVPGLSISSGIVCGKGNEAIEELLRIADTKMYQDKAAYYRRGENDRRKRQDS